MNVLQLCALIYCGVLCVLFFICFADPVEKLDRIEQCAKLCHEIKGESGFVAAVSYDKKTDSFLCHCGGNGLVIEKETP